MKLGKDVANAVVFVLFALAVLFLIPNQIEVISDSAINARFVPTTVAIALLALSALNLVLAVRKSLRAGGANAAIAAGDLRRHARPLALLGIFFLYAIAMEPVGFEAASVAVGGFILLLIGSRSWKYFLITSVFTVAVSLIFRFVFGIPLAAAGF